MLAGMGWFDALCHAFSTVAIGGFSTHDMSMGYFDSTAVNIVAIFFMFAAGINFSLHFFAWRHGKTDHYSHDPEFRAYAGILLAVSVLVVAMLFQHHINGVFQAVSIATTTGFTTAEFSAWPAAIPVLLIFASFVGGSAGSTAGGIKVIRCLLIYKQGIREIARLIHPSAEIPVKLGNTAVPHRVVDAVWGFFSVYIVVFVAMMLAMMATGVDQITAFSAVAATLNNLGPGLGDVSSGFMSMTDTAKWISVVGMLLGRLEIFTLLVLVTPMFWRR
jgi:trk system potassium uptake protein TrkH